MISNQWFLGHLVGIIQVLIPGVLIVPHDPGHQTEIIFQNLHKYEKASKTG